MKDNIAFNIQKALKDIRMYIQAHTSEVSIAMMNTMTKTYLVKKVFISSSLVILQCNIKGSQNRNSRQESGDRILNRSHREMSLTGLLSHDLLNLLAYRTTPVQKGLPSQWLDTPTSVINHENNSQTCLQVISRRHFLN